MLMVKSPLAMPCPNFCFCQPSRQMKKHFSALPYQRLESFVPCLSAVKLDQFSLQQHGKTFQPCLLLLSYFTCYPENGSWHQSWTLVTFLKCQQDFLFRLKLFQLEQLLLKCLGQEIEMERIGIDHKLRDFENCFDFQSCCSRKFSRMKLFPSKAKG